MVRKSIKEVTVFLTMLFLIVSNSRWLADQGIESYFEYGAYFLMICGIAVSFIKTQRSSQTIIRNICVFLVVSVLFSIGIALQGMSVFDRLRLIATMLVISLTAIISEDYLNSLRNIRAAGYGIFAGLLVTTALAFIVNDLPIETVYEGLSPYGFTGGVQYKNYFAAFTLGSFMSILFYRRYCEKKRLDTVVLIIELLFILASFARGTYVFVALFLFTFYADVWSVYLKQLRPYKKLIQVWRNYTDRQRKIAIGIACVAATAAVVGGAFLLVSISENYAYRFHGVTNYLKFVKGDLFHLMFGNAEMAWSMPQLGYVKTIRQIVGWNGTYEMGFINTLIKNGVFGLIGFVVLFTHIIRLTRRSTNHNYRMMSYSILCVLLVSSFVESFVCNIHAIFGVYCYLMLAGINGMNSKEETDKITPWNLLCSWINKVDTKAVQPQTAIGDNSNDIVVTICCTVYNHEPYLRKALDGFVEQKTNFPFEIVIHDDASTDNSAAIIREYCEKYPHLFYPIFQEENQYSKGVRVSRTFVYPHVRGKYVAICEGDDYWCDENKLQMQVDYMEAHPTCSMCVHDTAIINPNGDFIGKYLNGSRRDRDYSAEQVIRADGGGICQTSAYLAKRDIIVNRPELYDIKNVGDYPNLIYAGISGYVHYIGRVMSCYRVGHATSWSTRASQNKQAIVERFTAEYEDLTRIDRETNYKYTKAFAIPRGLRLSMLYRISYGISNLLKNPKHLWMVLRTHCYTFPNRMRKTVLFKLRSLAEREMR